jgi:hypothetical protein
VLRFLRVVILTVLCFFVLSLIMATGRPETGPIEDAVLVAAMGGLVALAAPVRRLGTTRS